MLRVAFMVSIFVFSFFSRNHALNKYDAYLVRAAIFFALFADCFLIINETYEIYVVGIISFSVCQLLHFLRYTDTKIFLRSIIIIPIVFLIFPSGFDIVVRVSVVYILCYLFSACGAVWAFATKKYEAPNRHLIIIATLFFLISDISVLFYNSPSMIKYQVYFLFLIWIFCLPAHILLSLSKIKLR